MHVLYILSIVYISIPINTRSITFAEASVFYAKRKGLTCSLGMLGLCPVVLSYMER